MTDINRVLLAPYSTKLSTWYLAGGISSSNCIAAYRPKGAASLAASYSNIANPGTYDAALGTAPTWDATDGWIFDGSSQYLKTGVIPTNDQTWSIIIRFSNSSTTTAYQTICGDGYNPSLSIWVDKTSNNKFDWDNGGETVGTRPALTNGVVCIAGTKAYKNATDEGITIIPFSGTITDDMWIGKNNYATPYWWAGYIQALAIYNSTLTSTQVSAVTTAINAL